MLWRRLIRKLNILSVNIIDFSTLEESLVYMWKIVDNPNSKLGFANRKLRFMFTWQQHILLTLE